MSERDDYGDLDQPPPGPAARLGHRVWRWLVTLAVLASVIVLGLLAAMESCALGAYDQVVILETNRPVRAVKYGWMVDDELRQAVGTPATPPPHYADYYRDGVVEDGKKFVAKIRYGRTSGPLRPTRVSHPPEIVVYVEFEDGSRTCQVANLPSGIQPPPITIHLP
jgi:hypothetical protein